MKNNLLYGVAGLFNTPDEIIKASKAISKEYTNFDVNTPYPVHGMDKAMGLKPSKLGYFALAFGLTGMLIALSLMTWVTTKEYPLVIGGKPFFSTPAFIPITFELTVLLASIGTVISMIFVFFKLPNNSHPIHDTQYMKAVSYDKFGIIIEAKDNKFDADKVKALLSSLGSSSISEIYYNVEDLEEDYNVFEKFRIFDKKFIGGLLAIAIVVSGLSYYFLNKLLYQAPFNWMMEQPRINAQGTITDNFKDGFGMRNPVEGTVARGFMPYNYKGQPEEAEKMLVNPSAMSEETILLGKKKYDIYCSPCHGYFGKGDARLNGQFPNPPSLHSDRARNFKDGRIFHIITEGQNNVMPGYYKQLTRDERWAVVNYVRVLQRSLNAKEEDLK
jgi:mono/diheme cytochrome c family protein